MQGLCCVPEDLRHRPALFPPDSIDSPPPTHDPRVCVPILKENRKQRDSFNCKITFHVVCCFYVILDRREVVENKSY